MKKFRIYAITPVEFGLFICSSDEKSVTVVMAGLQLASPSWEFIAYARIPDNHALDRKFPTPFHPTFQPNQPLWHDREPQPVWNAEEESEASETSEPQP
jgi:hypothetical protein